MKLPNSSKSILFNLPLFKTVAGNPGPFHTIISGFSQYKTTIDSLPQEEREKVRAVADFVANSFEPGELPILSIKIIGHADKDWHGADYEKKISEQRAQSAKDILSSEIGIRTLKFVLFKVPPGRPTPSQIKWDVTGVGSTQMIKKNATQTTEADRKKNQRVEIILEPGTVPIPRLTFEEMQQAIKKAIEDLIKNSPKPKPQPQPGPPTPKRPKWWKLPQPNKPDPWREFVKEVQDKLGFLDTEIILESIKKMLEPATSNHEELREMVDDFMDEWKKLEDERRRRQNNPNDKKD
jgi:outer membrane protein OmpA-like peptidoglycan-associated protein